MNVNKFSIEPNLPKKQHHFLLLKEKHIIIAGSWMMFNFLIIYLHITFFVFTIFITKGTVQNKDVFYHYENVVVQKFLDPF